MTTAVGVLALQGDVREHAAALERLGVAALAVRTANDLHRCDGLIVPGGESTTIGKLARTFGLLEPIAEQISAGLPVMGTCAGMVLLADRVVDDPTSQSGIGQIGIGGIDMTVRRNAFGRQIDSFERLIDFAPLAEPVPGVFIRAPWVEQVGLDVEVLARIRTDTAEADPAGKIVAVRHGRLMATSFHPEISQLRTGHDDRIHRYFVESVMQE